LRPHRVRNLQNRKVTHYIVELLDRSPINSELPMEANDRGSYSD
jgi:hypothetical protein